METQKLDRQSLNFGRVLREVSPEDFFYYWKLFTPLEQDIIKTLVSLEHALSVMEIRSLIASILYFDVLQKADPKNKKIANTPPIPYFKSSLPITFPSKSEVMSEWKKSQELRKIERQHGRKYYKYDLKVIKFLGNVGVKAPSFGSIENALELLHNKGFVVTRSAGTSKAKAYWALNPKFAKFIFENKIYERWK